jgi:WD40 repeat protein
MINRSEQKTVLAAFSRALGQERHNLLERPDILWQQMYNRLQWVDGRKETIHELLNFYKPKYVKPWFRLINRPMQETALIRTFVGHKESVTSCDFSADGKNIISGSEDGTLRLWDARTGKEKIVLKGHRDGVTACAFCKDGRMVVSASRDKTVRIWDAKSGIERAVLKGHTDAVECCVFSPDGKMIASAGDWKDKTVRIWDANNGNQLAVYRLNGEIQACQFTKDNKSIIAGAKDIFVIRIKAEKEEKARTFKEVSHHGCYDISISPDGFQLLVAAGTSTLTLYDLKKWGKVTDMKLPGGYDDDYWVDSCSFSPDGGSFVAGVSEAIRKFDASSHEELSIFMGHAGNVTACSFSPDGKTIVSASRDKTLKLWNAESFGDVGEFERHKSTVTHCSFSPDGQTIISAGDGGESCHPFLLRGKENYGLITPIGRSDIFVFDASFSPDGWLVATVGKLGGLSVYELTTKKLFYKPPYNPHFHSVFSPDGSQILTSYLDLENSSGVSEVSGKSKWRLVLFDLLRHSEITLEGHKDSILDCSFSPDGSRILSVSDDSTIRLWDNETYQELLLMRGHSGAVRACSYSQDGRSIVSGGDDGTLRIWNPETGRQRVFWEAHQDGVCSCAFSPDGCRIISGGRDGFLKLWDFKTAAELAIIKVLIGEVTDCAFSYNGRRIVVGDERGQVLVFSIENISIGPILATPYRRGLKLEVLCPYCQTKIRIKKSHLGAQLDCPECSQPLKINSFCLVRPMVEWSRESGWRRFKRSLVESIKAQFNE